MRNVWLFIVAAAVVSAAGCSSFETIPLADDTLPIAEGGVPVPVPRALAVAGISSTPTTTESSVSPSADDDPVLPRPVARPATVNGGLEAPSVSATAVSAISEGLHQLRDIAISSANAAEVRPVREVLFEEASFATDPVATPGALVTQPAPQVEVDPEAVERRDVKAVEGCVNDVFRSCPMRPPSAEQERQSVVLSSPATDEVTAATIGLIRAASIDPRTALWVLIGMAALLGLFISARRSAE